MIFSNTFSSIYGHGYVWSLAVTYWLFMELHSNSTGIVEPRNNIKTILRKLENQGTIVGHLRGNMDNLEATTGELLRNRSLLPVLKPMLFNKIKGENTNWLFYRSSIEVCDPVEEEIVPWLRVHNCLLKLMRIDATRILSAWNWLIIRISLYYSEHKYKIYILSRT